MIKPKSSSQLKQEAKGMMLGKYRTAISVLLTAELILTIVTFFTNPETVISITGAIIQLMITFIIILLHGILMVGESAFYLNIACNQPYKLSDLFTGFKLHPDKAILIQLFIQVLSLLPMIPPIVVLVVFFLTSAKAELFLIFCILLIIGCFISWGIALSYSQSYYLLLDFPNYNTKQLLKMSRKIMKGNIGRLLYIQVSFIPMTLLGLISFGLGLLFIKPYQNMTYALFYLNLIQCRNSAVNDM